jgi:GDP-L-fucose synthase
MIQSNIMEAAYRNGVKKLLFLGSSCIYPKLAPQPLKEEYLLSGYLEPTNQSYAIAKIAGIEMCNAYRSQYGCNFISAMPTNLYGPNDNYDLQGSHVLPALLRKMMTAKSAGLSTVSIWGTGTPRREFLHVDDMADACLFLMEQYDEPGHINIGCGEDLSILELTELIASIIGFTGEITTDSSQPDGTPRKLMDVSRLMALGWKPQISLQQGIENLYYSLQTNPAW